MIKATLNTKDSEETEISYPCLMRSVNTSRIVLMSSYGTGTVLNYGDDLSATIFKQGHFHAQWSMETFEPLPKGETVTLENI